MGDHSHWFTKSSKATYQGQWRLNCHCVSKRAHTTSSSALSTKSWQFFLPSKARHPSSRSAHLPSANNPKPEISASPHDIPTPQEPHATCPNKLQRLRETRRSRLPLEQPVKASIGSKRMQVIVWRSRWTVPSKPAAGSAVVELEACEPVVAGF